MRRPTMHLKESAAGKDIRRHPIPGKLFGDLLFALLLLTSASCTAEESAPLDLSEYDLTYSDEFDKIDVSRLGPGTAWIAHTPWNGDFGDAKFADPREGFPFTVRDGILRIEARKAENGGWESGLLSGVDTRGQGFSQQYGYFEMRAKLPPGPGVWPAFWLMGVGSLTDKHAKASAEIDVVEFYGHATASYGAAVHVWSRDESGKGSSQNKTVKVKPDLLTTDFHLYGASIDAEKIRIYLDRKQVWEIDTPPSHHQPMYMLVNLALGSGWPIENTPNPSVMLVDYVRVYARKPAP